MKIQILSDLHLSVAPMEVPRTDADVVVLAGDIARPQQAIQWALGFPQPVVYVPGNHEYYGGAFSAVAAELRALARGTRVHVLEEDALELGGVRFVGARRVGCRNNWAGACDPPWSSRIMRLRRAASSRSTPARR